MAYYFSPVKYLARSLPTLDLAFWNLICKDSKTLMFQRLTILETGNFLRVLKNYLCFVINRIVLKCYFQLNKVSSFVYNLACVNLNLKTQLLF